MKSIKPYPVDIILSPSWWHKNTGLTFDRDFYYHPARRVEAERLMEKTLHDKWGEFGLGEHSDENRPEVGPVHLAAGYLLSEMLGCQVDYLENQPPQVHTAGYTLADIGKGDPFKSDAFKAFENLTGKLKAKYGRLTGDVNWNGILNIALDLCGDQLFIDMYDDPDGIKSLFTHIREVQERFTDAVRSETGTTSVSVNRNLRHLDEAVLLHSECSHTMISTDLYEEFLMPHDIELGRKGPFGIHYCGIDPHRYAASFAKLPRLDFLDVGWGGDVKILRQALPRTFFNLRLSPVELISKTPVEIESDIRRLAAESGDPVLTGICCINMDDSVGDEKIAAILRTAGDMRKEKGTCNG
jgi:hypothetical protein